jgi:hypothetical protein
VTVTVEVGTFAAALKVAVTDASAVIVKLQLLNAQLLAGPVPAENRPGTWPAGAFATSLSALPAETVNVHCVAPGVLQRPPFPMTATVPEFGPLTLTVSVKLCAAAGTAGRAIDAQATTARTARVMVLVERSMDRAS